MTESADPKMDPVAWRADFIYSDLIEEGYPPDDAWDLIKALARGGYFNYIRKASDR